LDVLRIDKWLWFARFCKTRSLAQHLVEAGDVRLNDHPVGRPSTPVRVGDTVIFHQGRGWRHVTVLALGERRGPAPEARQLYLECAAPEPPPDDWR
jgi:ribosome-associated heat shock protein Hsp15